MHCITTDIGCRLSFICKWHNALWEEILVQIYFLWISPSSHKHITLKVENIALHLNICSNVTKALFFSKFVCVAFVYVHLIAAQISMQTKKWWYFHVMSLQMFWVRYRVVEESSLSTCWSVKMESLVCTCHAGITGLCVMIILPSIPLHFWWVCWLDSHVIKQYINIMWLCKPTISGKSPWNIKHIAPYFHAQYVMTMEIMCFCFYIVTRHLW